jgi:hypothetical protein
MSINIRIANYLGETAGRGTTAHDRIALLRPMRADLARVRATADEMACWRFEGVTA